MITHFLAIKIRISGMDSKLRSIVNTVENENKFQKKKVLDQRNEF